LKVDAMAVVSKELLFRTLQKVEQEFGVLTWKMQDINCQIKALQMHLDGMRQDIQNISRILVRHETRLDRIERRLEIAEAPV
jgi:outer membrane murein-binding lipoprotein Lpp